MSGNWEYGKQICKQGSILSLVTLCEHCRAVGSCTRNCVDGKGVQRGCSRGFWAPSAMLRSSPVLWLLLRLKLWSSLLTRLLSYVLILHIVHLFIAEIISVAAGEGGKEKNMIVWEQAKNAWWSKECVLSGSFCLVLIALRVEPVVSVWCCSLAMNLILQSLLKKMESLCHR